MERSLVLLVVLFLVLTLASSLTVVTPLYGLSTVLGISVLGSSVLGSSVLGSSVLGSSVLGSSVLGTTTIIMEQAMIEGYGKAILAAQLWLSLIAISLLVYLELTDPAYGKIRRTLEELRKSWVPVSALLVLLFLIFVALKIYAIIAG